MRYEPLRWTQFVIRICLRHSRLYFYTGYARRMLRYVWQPNSEVAQEIKTAVAQLLSTPAQAALAEQQMANGGSSK